MCSEWDSDIVEKTARSGDSDIHHVTALYHNVLYLCQCHFINYEKMVYLYYTTEVTIVHFCECMFYPAMIMLCRPLFEVSLCTYTRV